MNKTLLALVVASLPATMLGQSAIDAYNLSQTDTRGTARFMSMGGAFTALGGDLTTLVQNPAGIGVYRRSEIGVTLDISPRRITSTSATDKIGTNQTKVFCNNFGYIGTARLGGALQTFSWGASYNRVASFDRVYTVYDGGNTGTSLTNYIANFSNSSGVSGGTLQPVQGYNPYYDSDADWLSILAYNTLLMNPVNGSFRGLYQSGTNADALSEVRESGYVDEYAIDFGGNVSDILMWGVGFGITDLSYNTTSFYSESMENAYIVTADGSMTTGDAGYELANFRTVSGTGFNMKFGVIVKPVNFFRVGLAVHTPTWYSLSSSAYGQINNGSFYNPNAAQSPTNPLKVNGDSTPDAYYNFRLNSPWKLMVGAAIVIGNNAIISADYERQQFADMKVKYQNVWGNYVNDDYVNEDISTYFRSADIFRLGAELRVTPRFSLRAGYNYSTATATEDALDSKVEVYTAGMNPAYTLSRETNSVSFGLGYRWKAIYLDGAYVWKRKNSLYKPYTSYADVSTPSASLAETTNSIVLTLGVRF